PTTQLSTSHIYTLSLHDALPIFKGWTTPNFGLFWQDIRKNHPRVEVQPSVTEQGLRLELKSEQARLQISGEVPVRWRYFHASGRSEEHTSELQSLRHLVCRLLLE